ncbi:unnamed protein product [Camellia sinensis]
MKYNPRVSSSRRKNRKAHFTAPSSVRKKNNSLNLSECIAIVITTPGGPDVLQLQEVECPEIRDDQVLIRVEATAVNRADTIQRQGLHPPPKGESPALLVTSSQICTISTATLNYTINGYIREGNINDARKLFDENPFSKDIVSWNSMFSKYIKHDQIQHAQHLFDQMLLRDVVSWNAILSGLHKIKNPQGIYHCFPRMGRDGLRPNDFTFSIVISALTNTGFNLLIPQLHGLALRSTLNSCVFVGSSLMRGYTDLGHSKGLYLVFDEILAKKVTSWNALILGYMELGLSGEAWRAFEMMPEKNIISWTILVNGYIRNKELDEARSIFNGNCERNVVLWTVMVSGYVQNGCSSLLMGKQVHSNMLKSGIPFDVVLSTALVDMYAKCGDIEAAFYFFESVPKKDLATWNSVIGGYARHGLATRALEEFERMINGGVKPDQITFVNVLSACVHGGLVEEGERHFNSMTTKYGIKAGMEHYACMVDLYGRAGFLKTAVKLIEGMPFKPDVVVWGAFLAACSLHSSLELGEFAAKWINTLQKIILLYIPCCQRYMVNKEYEAL